jgi:hypothetical protein
MGAKKKNNLFNQCTFIYWALMEEQGQKLSSVPDQLVSQKISIKHLISRLIKNKKAKNFKAI